MFSSGATGSLSIRSDLALAGGVAVAATIAALAIVTRPSLAAEAAIGLVGLALLVWRPAVVVTVALIACQELDPAGFSSNPVLTFGQQVYFTTIGPLPLISILVVAGAAASLWWWQQAPAEERRLPAGAAWLLLGCGGLVAAVAFLQGFSPLSAVNQYARPFLVAFLCLLLGATAHLQPGGRRAVVRAGAVTLLAVAVVGGVVYATGGGAQLEGASLIFYDSALPAVAGAVLLALTLRMTPARGWWLAVLLVASAAVLILSFRRNVWLAVVLVLLLALVVRQGRARLLAWIGVGVLASWGLLAVIDPTLPGAIAGRAVSWIYAVDSGSQDASLQGHTGDLKWGWYYAQHSPSFFGWGPTHGPLPGLFGRSGYVYVHNEYLHSWLRFGILGLVAIAALVGVAITVALRRLRRHDGDALDGVAKALLLIAPIAAMTAPFFTSTGRWPALLGLAGGLLLAAAGRSDERPPVLQVGASHRDRPKPGGVRPGGRVENRDDAEQGS